MNEYFKPLFGQYYAPRLTKRELNQFEAALDAPTTQFLDTIIKPMAYDPEGRSYLSIDSTMKTEGRPHYVARDLVNGDADWSYFNVFTNALRVALPTDDDFNHPSDRVVMGPFQILTFEYDSKALSFFQHQLSWFRIPTNGKKAMDAPIGQFVRHLRSRYVDFVGLNVTYSGNKSFHYHFAFSTHVLASRVEDATSLRYGFHKAWETLAADMAGFAPLNIPETERPDPAVRFSEHFRRLPGGLRLAGSNQFFGVPEGTPMPQLTMWESVTTRAAPGAKASVFDPANFTLASVPVAQRKGSSAPVSFSRGSDESAYCEEKMRAIYDGETVWPRFEGFVHVRGELRAHFTNSLSDKKPQSYMGEGFRTVMIQGDNPLFLTNDDSGRKMPRLPKPLGEMIALWTEEYRQRFMAPGGRERTDLEQSFAEDAKDRVTAMAAIGQVLDTLITSDIGQPAAHFMSAPEGISKSRSLIANTPRFQKLLEENGLPPLIMFAFGNYDMAKEKAVEFEAAHPAPRFGMSFKPLVVPSFSRLYKETCAKLKVKEITMEVACGLRAKSVNDAIRDHQPEVINEMRRFYRGLHAKMAGKRPVLFTVHDVAHDWIKTTQTRLMFAPSYWNTSLDDNARRMAAREDTKLGLLIHDEVSAENLTLAHRAETVAWVAELADMEHPDNARRKLWPKGGSQTQLFEAFTAYADLNPPPFPLTFEEAVEIRDVKDWDVVETANSQEYGARSDNNPDHVDIYGATAGQLWAIHVRPWATQSAHRTLVLTTERVPTAVVRRIGEPWVITELDTPLIPKNHVEVRASRDVISANIGKLVADIRSEFPGIFAIGNKIAHVFSTKTHASAKGSNAFIGRDLVQAMVAMPPEQYAYFEALNAWTGRTDLIRLRHLDEFNQTAGRNLGFRAPLEGPPPRHVLLINRRLFESLTPLLAFARYEMREVVTRRLQKAAKAHAKNPTTYAAKPGASAKDRLAALRAALPVKAERCST